MDINQEAIPVNDDEYNIEILPENYSKYDISFKIIAIGDHGVGKTCLTSKAVRNQFIELTTTTVGFDFLTFNLAINNNIINLQIWDTCGQEVYRSVIRNFYRDSSLALILYAINDKDSFEHAQKWLDDLKEQANKNVRVFLVGNKSDLEEERVISKKEGEKFKEDKKLDKFMETSAKTGENAQYALVEAAKLLYKDYKKVQQDLANRGGQDNQNNQQVNKLELKEERNIEQIKTKKCCLYN